MAVSLESRIKGAITGVAVADAMGGPVEFRARGTFDTVRDYQYNPNFNLPPGAWTDDTSMTLCLAQSLITSRGFDPVSQLQNYIAWLKDGYLSSMDRCFDIGSLTRMTLGFWQRHIPPKSTSNNNTNAPIISPAQLESLQSELNKTYSHTKYCGNGSLMRTVPIGLFYFNEPRETLAGYAHAASQLTHPYSTNSEACEIYCILVAAILSHSGDAPITKQALFEILKSFPWKDPDLHRRFRVYNNVEDFARLDTAMISSSGYVVHSIEASLWAFFATNSWEHGCLAVVNLGDDADTVGAIYGGLAGAFYGLEAIPARWRENLVRKEVVGKVADDLSRVIVERAQQASSGA
ncbi:hypothetical protein ABW21_db0203976 [Orbilia brochopaga]|nr:hypothetical protein ABW21_db0203976 [Drechslerella brochopaga]